MSVLFLCRTSILSALYHHGWYLLTSTDISKKQSDTDSLIFKIGICPLATSFFAVSFNESDKIRLIGAPDELISAVQTTFGYSYIKREAWIYSNRAYEFKLYSLVDSYFLANLKMIIVGMVLHGVR